MILDLCFEHLVCCKHVFLRVISHPRPQKPPRFVVVAVVVDTIGVVVLGPGVTGITETGEQPVQPMMCWGHVWRCKNPTLMDIYVS